MAVFCSGLRKVCASYKECELTCLPTWPGLHIEDQHSMHGLLPDCMAGLWHVRARMAQSIGFMQPGPRMGEPRRLPLCRTSCHGVTWQLVRVHRWCGAQTREVK